MRNYPFTFTCKIIGLIVFLAFTLHEQSYFGLAEILLFQGIGFGGAYLSSNIYDHFRPFFRGYATLMKALLWWALVDIVYIIICTKVGEPMVESFLLSLSGMLLAAVTVCVTSLLIAFSKKDKDLMAEKMGENE